MDDKTGRLKGLVVIAFLTLIFSTLPARDTDSQGPLRDWLPTMQIPFAPDIPGATGISLAYSKGHLYAIGGATGAGINPFQTVHRTVYRGDISPTGEIVSWSQQADFGSPDNVTTISFAGTATSSSGRIYITGGRTATETTGATYHALPDDDSGNIIEWTKAPINEFAPRHLAPAVILNDRLYVIGGLDQPDLFTLDVKDEVIYSKIEPMDSDWTSTTEPLPFERYGSSAVALNNRIYVIGGIKLDEANNPVPINTVQYAQPISATGDILAWHTTTADLTPNPNEGLALMAAVAVTETNKIYVMGGWQMPSTSSAVVAVFSSSPDSSTGDITGWVQEDINDLPEPLLRHSAVFAPNGSIYVAGGQTTTSAGHQKKVYYLPTIEMEKSSSIDEEPLSEGSQISYFIDYANTSLITHNVTITDIIPWNVLYVPDSATPEAMLDDHQLKWSNISVPPGGSGQVSFQALVPLLPSLYQETSFAPSLAAGSPAEVLPVPISCNTTRFWANGVTRQPPEPNPHTIRVQIPPGEEPSALWLAMKQTDNFTPTVAGQPAQLVMTRSNSDFGASLWSATLTPAMVAAGQITVTTQNPRHLNAIFLFDEDDPPFERLALDDLFNTTKTFTYALDIPSVVTQTMDVLLPFLDITYWTDDAPPQIDARRTTVTAAFNDQSQTVVANDPNLGNGLLMTHFPFEIGSLDDVTTTQVLTVTVETEDSIYTLGPRVCRPVYVENTAWLCSEQAGCISDTAINVPSGFKPPFDLYLPIVVKSSS